MSPRSCFFEMIVEETGKNRYFVECIDYEKDPSFIWL